MRCPVFAAFGGADTTVPVRRSVAVLSDLLPSDPRHALAVFPGVGHALLLDGYDREIGYAAQLAAGFLPMLTGWLAASQRKPACTRSRPWPPARPPARPPAAGR